MKATYKQKLFYNHAKARINVAEGSVRSGKTVGIYNKYIQYIGNAPKGDLMMVGKTDGSLYRNIIRPMQNILGSQMRFRPAKKLINLWGRDIFTFGANDESSEGKIRGMTIAGAMGDELTLWPQSFFEQLLNRLSVTGAQAFFTTNTDSPMHWFKQDYLNRAEQLKLYSLKFLLDDNEFLDPDYVASLKNEKVGLWYKRDILGLWVLAEGAIYDFFTDDEPYILPWLKLPNAQRKAVAIDYGTNNPCAFGLYGINLYSKPKAWLEKEWVWDSKLKGRQCTDSEYAEYLAEFIGNEKITEIIVDPSAASFKAELIKNNKIKAVVVDADNSVVDGIRTVASMWKCGDFVISSRCQRTAEEAQGYVWCPKAQKVGEDKPIKANDHCMDRDRYFLQTTFGGDRLDYTKLTKR